MSEKRNFTMDLFLNPKLLSMDHFMQDIHSKLKPLNEPVKNILPKKKINTPQITIPSKEITKNITQGVQKSTPQIKNAFKGIGSFLGGGLVVGLTSHMPAVGIALATLRNPLSMLGAGFALSLQKGLQWAKSDALASSSLVSIQRNFSQDMFTMVKAMMPGIRAILSAINGIVSSGGFLSFLKTVGKLVSMVVNQIAGVITMIASSGVFGEIKNIFSSLMPLIQSVFKIIKPVIKALLIPLNIILKVLNPVIKVLSFIVGLVAKLFSSEFQAFKILYQEIIRPMVSLVVHSLAPIVKGIKIGFDAIVNVIWQIQDFIYWMIGKKSVLGEKNGNFFSYIGKIFITLGKKIAYYLNPLHWFHHKKSSSKVIHPINKKTFKPLLRSPSRFSDYLQHHISHNDNSKTQHITINTTYHAHAPSTKKDADNMADKIKQVFHKGNF